MKGFLQILLGCGVLALTGCAHMTQSSYAEMDRSPIRKAEVQQEILFSPAMLKDEYCFPQASTRQIFRWGRFGHEWTLRVQDPQIQYAGFYIRKPFELADAKNDTLLYFKLRPASAANQLSVVLIEGGDHATAHRETSLAAYQTDVDSKGWASYKIPLNEFLPVADPMFAQTGQFDWDDVRQIRFLRNVPSLSHDEIQIRNMRLRPSSFAALQR